MERIFVSMLLFWLVLSGCYFVSSWASRWGRKRKKIDREDGGSSDFSRVHSQGSPPRFRPWYYGSLQEKIEESLSVSNCMAAYSNEPFTSSWQVPAGELKDGFIKVHLSPLPRFLKEQVETDVFPVSNATHSSTMYQIAPSICNLPEYKKLRKGRFRPKVGCHHKLFSRAEIARGFQHFLSTMHPNHSRCSLEVSRGICRTHSIKPAPMKPHGGLNLANFPFVAFAQNAVISSGGHIAMPCGTFGYFGGCEMSKVGTFFSRKYVDNGIAKHCREDPTDAEKCGLPVYDTVFVSTQWDDTQIGQFMLEGIPKVVWHLDFLLKNPDIKIHYGLANAGLPSFLMSHYLFATLGLDQRLINGSVYAKNVIMPREGGCQDVGYNAWEVLHMRDKLLRLAFTGDEYKEIVARAKRHQQQGRPRSLNILLVQRTASRFTQNQGDRARRRWTVAVMAEVVENFRNNFPGFNISVFSDRDVDIMVHPEKAVRLFGRADIVVGMHGAGLTNAMFMQPGSILVETVVTLYDSRFLPYTGNFPRLSSLVGFHHFHYYQETQRTRRFWIDAPKLAADVATYVNQVFRFKDN